MPAKKTAPKKDEKVSPYAKPGSKCKKGFIRVEKNGLLLDIHPDVRLAHAAKGWKPVDAEIDDGSDEE